MALPSSQKSKAQVQALGPPHYAYLPHGELQSTQVVRAVATCARFRIGTFQDLPKRTSGMDQ